LLTSAQFNCVFDLTLQIACAIRESLDLYFPEQMGVRIIAEPGRYFATSAFTLAVNVIARRIRPIPDSSDQGINFRLVN